MRRYGLSYVRAGLVRPQHAQRALVGARIIATRKEKFIQLPRTDAEELFLSFGPLDKLS